jgi:cyanate permease
MQSDLIRVFTHSGLLLLVVVGTARLFISHGLANWLPTILETRDMTPALAATLTSLFILIRIIGIIGIPVLSDRFETRRLPVIFCGFAGTVGMLGLIVARSIPTLLFSLLLVGTFVIGGLSPLIRAIPIEMDGLGPRFTAVANGLIFTIGEIGGFTGPFLIGFLYDLTGSFVPALGALAVASFLAAVAGYYMNEPSNSKRPSKNPNRNK